MERAQTKSAVSSNHRHAAGPGASAERQRTDRLNAFFERHDLAYVLPMAIAVAAFVFAMFAYFGPLP